MTGTAWVPNNRAVSTWAATTAVYIFGAVVFSLYAFWSGQDANWDLQNYHNYAAYALLHWRYPLDVAPGGFQGYLNPLPYLPPYLLRSSLSPLLASLGLAAQQAVVVPITWHISGALHPTQGGLRLTRVLATIVGCASATTLSEIGTSFADLILSIFVLGGVLALLKADQHFAFQNKRWLAVAGFSVGMAAGMKLTNGIYAVGLGAACFVPFRNWLALLRSGLCVGTGFLAGFLLTDGFWGFYLWRTFGNPIFPGMNTFFKSSSAALSDYTDLRFLPKSWIDGMLYPLRIAEGRHPTAEIPFSDPRLLLALPIGFMVILSGLFTRFITRQRVGLARRRMLSVALFLTTSFVTWIHFFAIQRYAIALEILAGVIVVQVIARFVRGSWQSAACIALMCGTFPLTRPGDWWHRPWGQVFQPSIPSLLLKPAAFLVVSVPNGYWASILPEASRFYNVVPMGLAGGGVLQAHLLQGLQNPPNRQIWTLGADVPMSDAVRQSLGDLGFVPAPPCVRVESLWWVDTVFCRAVHVGARHLAAASLNRDIVVDFSHSGAGWIFETSGWLNSNNDGAVANASSAGLVLSPEVSLTASMLDASIIGPLEGVSFRLKINGSPIVNWRLPKGGALQHLVACVPPTGIGSAPLEVVFESKSGAPLSFTLRSIKLVQSKDIACYAK